MTKRNMEMPAIANMDNILKVCDSQVRKPTFSHVGIKKQLPFWIGGLMVYRMLHEP